VKLALLRVLFEVGGRMPARLLYACADLAGTLAWLVSPRLRAVTRDHMAHIPALTSDLERRDEAARGCVRSAARYWADLARTSRLTPAEAIDEYVSFEGIDRLFEALDRGCGVVLVTAHLGAPEFAVRVASQLGLDVLALTQRNESPAVNDLLHRVRRSHGGRFAEAGLSGTRLALEQLRRGGAVALIADRDITRSGASVPFFGERTTLPTGPIELAQRTGASLLPCFVFRVGAGRYSMRFERPLRLGRGGDDAARKHALLALARALESGIERAPDQWFVLQPIWRGLPPGPAHATGGH
jgi:KDO2-lipid IV(A) lauroyltransferase